MEVWLESLSMHLSVGMPLPPDLLFDIHHYKGQSPSSSGSTTPEGIPSGHRSPALEPICEGQPTDTKKSFEKLNKSMEKIQKSNENFKPLVKVSSAENLLKRKENGIKPIIKVSSSTTLPEATAKSYEFSTKSCENMSDTRSNTCNINTSTKNNPSVILSSPEEFPNYENIDFLKNDMAFAGDGEKPICIQELKDSDLCKINKSSSNVELNKCSLSNNENNLKQTSFNVNLRSVPKNFTRNRFAKELKETVKDDDGPSVRDKFKFLSKSKTFDIKPLIGVSSKLSNLNLDSIGLKSTTLPSQVTRKYVNSAKNVNLNSNNSLQSSPSSFKDTHTVLPKSNSFDKSISDACDVSKPSSSKSDPTSAIRSSLLRRRYAKESECSTPLSRRTPVLQKRNPLKSPTKEKTVTPNDNQKAKQLTAAERLKETLTAHEKLPTSHEKSPTCREKSPTSHEKSHTGHEKSHVGHGKSPTGHEKSQTGHEKSTTSLENSSTENLPATQAKLPDEKVDVVLTKAKTFVEQETKPSLLNKLTPILQRRTGFLNLETEHNVSKKPFAVASSSGNIVRDMVDNLNKKGSLGFGSRINFGRSSLKVTGSTKTNSAKTAERFSPTKEYTAL